MDTFSEEFKAWMDTRNFTAETLAPIIGRSPQTIANWRSIGVPERESVRRFLRECMEADEEAASDTSVLRIDFTDDELEQVETAARIVGTRTRDFIRRSAISRARVEIAARNTGEEGNGRATA